MEQMKRVFSRMLEDPQAPPLRDSTEVMAAARRSMRRDVGLRVTAAAMLAAVVAAGSWTVLRNDFGPPARPYAAPSASLAPVQLTAADVADRLEPRPTPTPMQRMMWIIEGKARPGRIFWYIDMLAPVADPCELPYDVPYAPDESCVPLSTPAGQVWVRRQHASFAAKSTVVSIYVPVSPEKAFLYTASSIELPGNGSTWNAPIPGPPFEIADVEIGRIANLAYELAQG